MGLKVHGADEMLDAVVGEQLTISLHTAEPTDANELTNAGGYSAKNVASRGTTWEKATVSGYRRLRNKIKISFATPTGTWSALPTHLRVEDAAGNPKWTSPINVVDENGDAHAAAPVEDQVVSIPIGSCYIELSI